MAGPYEGQEKPCYDCVMGTVNKQSVREEVDRIKAEFDRISSDKKTTPEINMLFQSMFIVIDLILSIFLEKTTKKNNKNSSKPSSQTEKDASSLSKTGANGKGKPELKEIAYNTRTVETIEVAKVIECNVCGKDLSKVPCQSHERRTKIDILFEKTVTYIDAEIKPCEDCDATVKGKFPADMPGPLQYGNGLKAYVINLLVCQMISLNRVQKLVKSMIGEVLSESSLLKFVLRLNQLLEKWETNAIEGLLLSPAMNVDETSLRVEKQNYWIHVHAAGEITLKLLHRKRGTEAINDINIIPRYSGVAIHDCWASYLTYNDCSHGLCGSHLVRELTCAIEANGYSWAYNMKTLLLETCRKVSKSKSKKLKLREYANLQKRYRNILTRGEKELPVIPPKPNGKRGKMAKSDAHNLWERLKKHEFSVLLFAKNSAVSFTNNRAERDLRMSKVKQKVSGCFRTELYAQAYCRISSYLQTMATKGYNPLIAIQMAFSGEFI
jgi:transposase